MTRSHRRLTVATARKPHARARHALHARTENRPAHGTRDRAICEPRPRTVDSTASFRNVSKTLRNDA
eukprot:5837515-Lingulodinium_polyedra.AAC.1